MMRWAVWTSIKPLVDIGVVIQEMSPMPVTYYAAASLWFHSYLLVYLRHCLLLPVAP